VNARAPIALAALCAALLLPADARAQDAAGDLLTRGDTLYYEGDYYRAITEYKRYLAVAPDDDARDAVRLKIAWMYAQSEQHAAAAATLRDVRVGRPADDRLALWSTLYFADMALEADRSGVAEQVYTRAIERCQGAELEADPAPGKFGRGDCRFVEAYARLGRARLRAKAHDFDGAARELDLIPPAFPHAARAAQVAAHVRHVELPHKSPALAGTLSIVPGLGHFYIEEYGAGAVAMVWNGAFIYAFVDSIVSQRYGQAALIGLVELIWYSGTIFGAVSGANRFNRDARRIVEEGISRDLDAISPTNPWPMQFPVPDAPVLNLELKWEW
jgi:tetratricopeptide (TPR) repeat protein